MATAINFNLAPAQAVEFFRAKGLKSSFAWQDMLHEEHDRAFTIAKMMDLDLLSDVKDYVDQAISEGWTFKRFHDELKPELARRGWWGEGLMRDPASGEMREVQLGSVRRLETIYDVNLKTAYSAGQSARIEENARFQPYVMYAAVGGPLGDGRNRAQHLKWHGTVLRWDDPWWKTHTPPNGYGCRCTRIALSERGLAKVGKKGPDEAPPSPTYEWTNPRTGEIVQVPVGVDPGFGYAPGASRSEDALRLAREKAAAAPPEFRQPFLDSLK